MADTKNGIKDWCLISSDPEIFDGMITQYGFKDVKTRFVYPLGDISNLKKDATYGIILAYQYYKEKKTKKDKDAKNIVFTEQLDINGCATVSIINILSNFEIQKHDPIKSFLTSTEAYNSNARGQALVENDEIRNIHNSFDLNKEGSREDSQKGSQKNSQNFVQGGSSGNTQDPEDEFHYVSYIAKDGYFWELDGLKAFPLKIKRENQGDDWAKPLETFISKKINGDLLASIIALVKPEEGHVLRNEESEASGSSKSAQPSKIHTQKWEDPVETDVCTRAFIKEQLLHTIESETSVFTSYKAQSKPTRKTRKRMKTKKSRTRKLSDKEETKRHMNAKKRFNLRR